MRNFIRETRLSAVSLIHSIRAFPDGPERWLVLTLLFAGLVRLLTLGAYPLFDNTEARYAEIARKMVETHNWVTPQYGYGVPFWGKPPLSTWATAASFLLFGVNEFGARISSFLFAALTVWLVYRLAAGRGDKAKALAAAMVMATTALFFVAGGGVMTDPALVLGTTLSMVSFWIAVKGEGKSSRIWGYLFFVGLGIGLLAKGPVAMVLTLFPVGVFVAWKRQWPAAWPRMPWLSGIMLMTFIALPWYLAAERATPGFLKYFIVGEHWERFTNSGWRGDLYGTAHSRPHGIIWLYWLGATFPWCFVFIGTLLRRSGRAKALIAEDWTSYLLLWAVTPMLFFSLAGNILWTYVLPGIPAFALLVSELLGPEIPSCNGRSRWLLASAGLTIPLVFAAIVLIVSPREAVKVSQKDVVSEYREARTSQASRLVYLYKRPYSAEFYSNGRALEVNGPEVAEPLLHSGVNFFAIEKGTFFKLPEWFKARLEKVGDYGKYELFSEKPYMLHSMAPAPCHHRLS